MTNKSGQIGTWTEASIVIFLRGGGFGGAEGVSRAERIRPAGAADEGDIGVCPGVMIQSKGGHAAETASDQQITDWLEATERQRVARGADVAALVTKRKGKGRANAGAWWVYLPGWTYVYLGVGAGPRYVDGWVERRSHLPAVRISLDAFVDLLRSAGYGDPLGPSRKDTPA